MELTLSKRAEQYLRDELKNCRYSSPEEIVEAAIEYWCIERPFDVEVVDPHTGRTLDDAELAAMIQVGIDDANAGRLVEFDAESIKHRGRERLKARQREGS
jgi:hypothetical protein